MLSPGPRLNLAVASAISLWGIFVDSCPGSLLSFIRLISLSAWPRKSRSFPAGIIAAAIFALAATGLAQTQVPQVLRNNVRPEVTSGQAQLVSAMPLDKSINFSVMLPLRNEPDLDSLLAQLYDPSSPNFHYFLTVDQFTQRFGPTAQDYQAVVAFAQSQGFTVTGTPANRLIVPLSGTVAQVETAFNIRMNVYQHPTENRTFFSPDREPSLNLLVPVAHISGLDSFSLPKPRVVPPSSPDKPQASDVTGSGPGGNYLGSDMRAAYYGGTTLDGNGQSVALLEFDGYNLSDVNSTFTSAGQTYNVAINNVLLDGATGQPITYNGSAEVVLDIVQAIGMAPGLSQVRVYIGSGSDDANILNSMASENIAKQISSSWSWRPADPSTDDPFFKEFAAQGQSFFAASGDDGAYDATIDPFFYPQEDAYVTAVGGTHLTTNGAGGSWSSETAWNSAPYTLAGSGGGISPDSIAIPSWQTGIANSSNGGSTTLRNVPDVAMEGDFDNYTCIGGTCTGGWAGTSFAAPRWAGFMALVNEQAVEAGTAPLGGIGSLNPSLYIVAEGTPYATDLHDITEGNNDTENQPTFWNAVAGYDLVTGWGSPAGQPLIDDLAGHQVPGFWLIGSPSTVGVLQGSTSSTTISVTDAGGFTGNVTLALSSALPTGVTASWGTNPTSNSSLLTFTAAANAPASTTPLTITGSSGNLKVTTVVTLAVHAPTFVITPSPASLGLSPGSTGTSGITVTPEYGFSGSVNLSISGLPAGVTGSFSPSSTTGASTLTVNVGSSAASGTYNLSITGTSGSLTVSTPLVLTIHAPTFEVDSAGSLNVGQGASATTWVYILPSYQFSGNVNLTVSGLPTGVTASFSPNPTPISGTSYGYSTLTVTTTASAPAGTSTLTITGTSGSTTASTTLSLVIHQPTFTLFSPQAVDMGQGTSTSTFVEVSGQYGFNGNVTFSVTGLPAGVTAAFSPNPSTGYSTLTLTASSSTALGSTNFTITGTSGGVTATSTTTLTIHQPTFTLYSQSGVDLGQNSSTSTYVAINPQYGFSGNVTFSVTGLPTGVTALWNPNPTTGSTNLTLTAGSSAAVGSSKITITGTSGAITASTTTTLTIHAPSFTLNSYSQVNMGQGSTGTAYIYVQPSYGFAGNVSLAVSGLPSGVTASFSPNPTANSSTLTFTASSSAAVGTKTITITGTSGTLSSSTTITLSVYTPTFTIYGTSAATVGQGTATPLSFYINSEYGFSSNVNFSVSGLPAGVTASFSPNPTTSSTTLTLTASGSAAVGQSTLTVTGTSGSQTATTAVTLNVGAPTFTLGSYGSVDLGQGTSSTSSVWIYPQYGFAGNVNFSISGLPTGVTASFSPNPATSSTTLTLTASGAAALGQYNLTITGTSGSISATSALTLAVHTPSFTLSAGGLNLGVGMSGTTYAFIYSQYGFSGNVNLSVTGLPSGVTASFSPNPVAVSPTVYSSSSTLTVTSTGAAVPGQYTLTVTGTSGSQTVTTNLYLTLNGPSFYLYCSGCYFNLNQGASAQTTMTVSPQYGFAGSVNLAATGLPSGVTATFSPNPTTSTSTLTLSASDTATPINSAPITITGTSGSMTNTTTGNVTVNAQGFTLSDAPGEVNLAPGGSGKSTVSVISQNGFSGSVNLSASGLPSGVTATFSQNPATGSSVLTLSASSSATHGSSTIAINGVSGSLAASTPLVVNVDTAAPSATATKLQISAGGSAVTSVASGTVVTLTATVSAGSTALKSGQVNFCTGVATGCDPTHMIGSAQLTSAGTATLKFIPGMGARNYKAVFVGTNSDATSSSADTALTVTASQATSTTIASTGSAGDYTLTATVTGQGSVAPTGSISFLDATRNNSVLATAALKSGKATIGWGNPQSPGVGSYPVALAVGDFNRDGILDLAVVNSSTSNLSILLGKGDGTFAVSSSNPQTGTSPTAIVVGDFNGDGIPDLAVANSGTNNISIFLGVGDGTFSATANPPETGSGPSAMVVGDFNGDGKLDLATANNGSGTVTVELGNGDGTFTPSPLSAQTVNQPRSMAVGDFNGDGILDLALVGGYGSDYVTVLLGNGDGSFAATAPINLPANSNPWAIAAGDFNQDGKLDLAVATYFSNSIYILLGNGDGSFAATTTPAPGLSYPNVLVVADLDGDGNPDLAETNGSQLGILSGNGDGTFGTLSTLSAGTFPDAIAAGDFNGDGSQDLAITSTYSNTLDILTTQLTQNATATATGVSPVGTGTHNAEAKYPGDTGYLASMSSTIALTAELVTPTVTVTPSASSITTTQALTVTVAVAGGSGNPTPTGTVTLSSGSYTSSTTTLSSGSATINIPGGSLALGTDTLTVTYTPDSAGSAAFKSATGTASVNVAKVSPTLTVTPSSSGITTTQALKVNVTVSGGTGNPVPTGSVTLTSGSYTSSAAALSNGSTTINIPAGSLAIGTDTLAVAYTPDSSSSAAYNSAAGSASVTVTQAIGTTVPVVTLTASASNITNLQSVTVAVTVAGPSGQAVPTGTVTLSSGSWSAQQTLGSGGASFTIPAGALASGTDTITAAYSGDPNYATASGTTTVAVVPILITAPTLNSVAPGSKATGNVTLSAGSNYSGTLTVTCALLSSPAGAQSLPTCSLNPAGVTLASGGTGTTVLTVSTTAASTASLVRPPNQLWKIGGAGSVLAALFICGIPARRRRWLSMLVLLFFFSVTAVIGCGGGGGGGGTQPPPTTPGTTAGSYTFTLKAADSTANVSASANVTLTVQ